MSDLEDYGALLRSGAASVPDYAADEARKQLLSLQRAQEQRLTAEAKNELAEQHGFQNDLTTVLAHPSAQGYSALIAKHPKFAQQVKSSWDLLDQNRQKADLQQMSEVYSAAANGKHDLAAALMQRRIEADKSAGQDTTHDQAIFDALSSGDPVQQKGALGMIGVTLSAVTGPDKFEQTLGALTKGTTPDIRNVNAGDDVISIDPNTGQARSIYKSPYVKTADGGILERDGTGGEGGIVATGPSPTNAYDAAIAMGMDPKLLDPRLKTISTGGGDPASPGAAQTTAPGGFDHAVEHVLSNEGGYNPSDMNGAPVNFGINQKANPGVDVKNMTVDQAKQIYHDKYWVPSGAESLPANLQAPYFDVYIRNPAFAKKALADSGGDPAKFMAASSAYFQKLGQKPSGQPYAEAWANRDAKNTAIATGGGSSAASPTAEGAPPGYHWLTPPKPKDAPSGYRYAADGKTLEAIPGGPADPDGVKNAGPLKPDALRTATVSYIKTGKMPAGMGGQALKNQILNYVPQIMDEHGLTPDDMPSIQQQFGADSAAFKQRVGQLSYMRQSVGKLNQHAQDLSALIKAIPLQSNITPFNWITQGMEGSVSNSTLAQLRGGLPLFESEVARVMTGNPNSGSGQLSDDARHEFDILHSSQAPKAKIDAMNRIMKMVEESVKATRDETGTLKGRIGGGIDVYAGNGPQAQPAKQEEWITLPSGLKIRKIK